MLPYDRQSVRRSYVLTEKKKTPVVGRVYLLQLKKLHTEENGHELNQHF